MLAQDEPDAVGLSLYLWNSERSLHLANEIKKRSPHTRIIVGGPEVTTDNVMLGEHPAIDSAVIGEAEEVLPKLLDQLLAHSGSSSLPGVAIRQHGKLGAFNAPPPVEFPLASHPSPYLLGLIPVDPERATYVETVRGCRSKCTFCFYPRSSSSLRTRSILESAQMIQSLMERGARDIVFLDPTFNHRPEFVPLLERLAEINTRHSVSFSAEVRAEGLTPQHAQLLARANFTQLEIGLQSVRSATLRRIGRGGSPDKVARAATWLKEAGIDVTVDLIVGLPGESASDILAGIDFLIEADLADHAQIFPLAVLPGTPQRTTAAADGIIYDTLPPYIVRRTSELDEAALLHVLLEAELRLGRSVDELPRPHLVSEPDPNGPLDVFHIDCDSLGLASNYTSIVSRPGAWHAALWVAAHDLVRHYEPIQAAISTRIATDPYSVLDVILAPKQGHPLLDATFAIKIRTILDRDLPTYLTRVQAHRGMDLQRRLSMVLPSSVRWDSIDEQWLKLLRDTGIEVYRNATLEEALLVADELGAAYPAVRITDHDSLLTRLSAQVTELARRADPDTVTFASRRAEREWQRTILGYGESGATDLLA
jgi:hypothetical protein